MASAKKLLGDKGEKAVSDHVACPRCNRSKHLTGLRANFQCADLICKFCGYLAQVKTTTLAEGSDELPAKVLGAGWAPQHEQIMAGIYHGLFIVGYSPAGGLIRIDYVPAHILQTSPEVFEPRNPLGPTAKRAGWRGFSYNLERLPPIGMKRVYPT